MLGLAFIAYFLIHHLYEANAYNPLYINLLINICTSMYKSMRCIPLTQQSLFI